jgi:uncharacterized protein YndB with AHSA1/START domain
MTSKNNIATTASREMTATRVFDAPRELVFDAWTDPVHISKWWGPAGFTTTTVKMDVRPGGVWEHVMHGPDGTDYESKIVYVELTRPERVVYDHVLEPLFRSTTTLEDLGGKTRISVTLVFASAEAFDTVVREHKADVGLTQMLTRLGEHVATKK